MVAIRGAAPHTRPVGQPQAAPFGLFLGHFEPFSSPQPLDPLVIHAPAFPPQQPRDPPIAIPPILGRQRDDPFHQPRLIHRPPRRVPVGRPRLAQHATRPPLGDAQLVADMGHRLPASGRAQKFPEVTSQDRVVEGVVGHQLLELRVLPLELLEPLGLVEPQAPILLPPPVVGLLADPELLTDQGCQGRSKNRPPWRRKTRPSGSGSECLKAAARGEASGCRSGRGLAGFLAVFEAIALAVQLQDVDVMRQPIEQRARQPFGAEDLGPFVEG